MVFAHGFGCDQNMWRFVAPAFEDDYRVVLFDHVGAGGSDLSAYDLTATRPWTDTPTDVLEICRELDLRRRDLRRALGQRHDRRAGGQSRSRSGSRSLVLVGPSPRYIDDEDYVGGFTREDIDGLLESLDSNYLGWSSAMAPVIMGNADRPELGEELTNSFCRTDPEIAKQFARVTFLSDNRDDLSRVSTPSLILQCSRDVIAPEAVGDYVHGRLAGSTLVQLQATGHCPNLSAPEETVAAIESFLNE